MNKVEEVLVLVALLIITLSFLNVVTAAYWKRKKNNAENEWNEKSLRELSKHGYDAHLYLASIGEADMNLRSALVNLSSRGYVITDSNGVFVGKFAKAILDSTEVAEQRRATFKIIK